MTQFAFETLQEQSNESVKTEQEIIASLKKAITDTKNQLSRLDDLYLKGAYEGERENEYELKRERLTAKLEGFQTRLAEQDKSNSLQEGENDLYSFAKNVVGWFTEGGFRTRIQIINSLGGKGKIQDKTVELTLDAVFVELKKTLDEIRVILPSFEPANFGGFALAPANQATVATIKSTWLPGSDSNRQPSG